MSRSRRSRRLFYRRSFLNRPGHHAGAHAIAEIREAFGDEVRYVDAELTISDCRRVIVLDFSVASNESANVRSNALHKARVLRDVVVAFHDQLAEAYADEVRTARR